MQIEFNFSLGPKNDAKYFVFQLLSVMAQLLMQLHVLFS